LSILSLSWWAARVLLRKSLPIPISSRVFPALSCTNFRVLGVILRSLIHFELILVQGDKHGSSFRFCRRITTFPNNICWRGCLFSILYFYSLCQKWGGHSCVDSYLGPLFCSTGLHVVRSHGPYSLPSEHHLRSLEKTPWAVWLHLIICGFQGLCFLIFTYTWPSEMGKTSYLNSSYYLLWL
jgi:hypothetical protein